MDNLLKNFIPQKFEIGQNFLLKIHVQKAVSLSILDGFQQMRAHQVVISIDMYLLRSV